MPRASRVPVKEKVKKDLIDNFVVFISKFKGKNEAGIFIDSFFTDEEKTMIEKRLMIHLLLKRGYKNFQIQQLVTVSRETVRVHKNLFENSSEEYKRMIGKMVSRVEIKEFMDKVEKLLQPVDNLLGAKTNIAKRAKILP